MAGEGLVKGNAECSTGLSKRVFDFWVADTRSGFVSPLEGVALGCVKAICWSIAQGVVDEIKENAKVNGARVE